MLETQAVSSDIGNSGELILIRNRSSSVNNGREESFVAFDKQKLRRTSGDSADSIS